MLKCLQVQLSLLLARHAFLEETWAESLLLAIRRSAAEGRRCSRLVSDASRVKVIDRLRVVEWAARRRSAVIHDCEASLNAGPFTISTFLHRILTCRQGLDVGNDNIAHDFILTAERGRRDARQLLLIVQRLFATPVENVTIRFYAAKAIISGRRGRENKTD